MKRYSDIAHYRAPYKDVMLSGFGADDGPAPISAAPKMSKALADGYEKLFANSTMEADGIAVVNDLYADNLIANYLAKFRAWYDGSDSVNVDIEAPATEKQTSALDWIAYLTGRAGVPVGEKGNPSWVRPDRYVMVTFGETSDGRIFPSIVLPTKDQAKAFANSSAPLMFALLVPGQKLGPLAASALKNFPLKQGEARAGGLSTASMLGYGALGLAAIAGIYLAFGKTKKSPKYETNPRKARKAKKSRRARKVRKARRVIHAR